MQIVSTSGWVGWRISVYRTCSQCFKISQISDFIVVCPAVTHKDSTSRCFSTKPYCGQKTKHWKVNLVPRLLELRLSL